MNEQHGSPKAPRVGVHMVMSLLMQKQMGSCLRPQHHKESTSEENSISMPALQESSEAQVP